MSHSMPKSVCGKYLGFPLPLVLFCSMQASRLFWLFWPKVVWPHCMHTAWNSTYFVRAGAVIKVHMFSTSSVFLGTSVIPIQRLHWRQMDCFWLWASTTKEAATNGIRRLPQHNLWLGCIHFLFSFLFYYRASCDYSDGNISEVGFI